MRGMEKPVEHPHGKKKAGLAVPWLTVSIDFVSGIPGQARMLLQGSGKDGQQLDVPGTGCTKGLHPGWGEIHYSLRTPLISLGEGISAFLFSQCNLNMLFFEGESHRSCPSFPFSSPDSGGCFSLAALISSQAPPCCDGGTLFLENHFNRKIPLQVPMTHSLCLFGAEAWGLQ